MEAPPPTLSLSLTLTQPQPMEALYSVAWRLDTLSHGGSPPHSGPGGEPPGACSEPS